MRKYLVISILLITFMPATLLGENIYVDKSLVSDITNGTYSAASRDNSGSDGNAYRSISAGINVMKPGDVLYIRGGIYYETQINISTKSDGSITRPYKVCSYPGEWAIIDGRYTGSGDNQSVIYGLGSSIAYWTFERLEIKGGGRLSPLASKGAGIYIEGAKNCTFRCLYVHDNFGDTVNAGAAAGIMLTNAPQNNIIEFCYIRHNGSVAGSSQGIRNSAIANIALYSDYKYADAVTQPESRNIIRHNLIDGNPESGSTYTNVGIIHKGFQRLTGYNYGEKRDSRDNLPNSDNYKEYGDKIYNNIIINHTLGMRLDQDYVQVFNNIIWNDNHGVGVDNSINGAIHTRDNRSERRGPYKPCIYNNTIYADSAKGIVIHLIGDTWNTTELPQYFSDVYVFNNIIDSFHDGYDWSGISVESGEQTKPVYALSKMHLSRNFFYRPSNNNLVYINVTKYSKSGIEQTVAADRVWVNNSLSPYKGTSGADKFKAKSNYVLDASYRITNGGIGGSHPYLSNTTIPTYVGATDPYNDQWVDKVFSLSNVINLIEGEGQASIDVTPPAKPSGVNVFLE